MAAISRQSQRAAAFLPMIEDDTTINQFDNWRKKSPDYKYSDGFDSGKHALICAAEKGNASLVEHIVKEGGNELVNLTDHYGRTALHCVCFRKPYDEKAIAARVTIINTLIKCGANINAQTLADYRLGEIPAGATPIWVATHRAKSVNLIAQLLQHKAKLGSASFSKKGAQKLSQAQKILSND